MDNALYFPFISVPENPWFTRTLLYWDQVGAIIPYEFVDAPEQLTVYTRDLLRDGLLTEIHPGQHLWKAPRFKDAFLDFMESLPKKDVKERRRAFRKHSTSRIHTEKMEQVADYLIDAKLATKVNWSWCDVENKTAQEFMAYLAALLGQLEDVQSTPVTDTFANLDPFLLASQSTAKVEARLTPLRTIVLEQLLPVPEQPVSPAKLLSFKQKHGTHLRHFRHSIEQEISNIADMTDSDLQTYRLDNFTAEKKDEVEEIKARLSEGGLGRVVFSTVCAVVAAIPGVNVLFGLANAVYSSLAGSSQQPKSGALLYAVYVQKKFR